MPIRKLPESVSSGIAAGEVVERPASVVKELVENALDAGASRIEIRILGGGRELIEVADNGSGIPPLELPLAVERFSTSKLHSLEDLFALRTLGFRGEALASIAAVAKLEITTRTSESHAGTRLTAHGGRSGAPASIAAAVGTLVRVSDLFFNVPARVKFLKSENTERRWISKFVTRYALAYPQVSFSLTSEGRQSFHTAGNGDRSEILAMLYGPEVGRGLIPLPPAGSEGYAIEGSISPPSVHRSNRGEITLFVNGRWVQDVSLTTAVVQAYHALMMVGRYPIAALFLQIPPEEVDVNVHPAKAEVRFRRADLLFSVVQRSIRATLLGAWSTPALGLGGGWSEPADQAQTSDRWSVWISPEETIVPERVARLSRQPSLQAVDIPILRSVGQVGATYLVAEGPDGIYLIDQHAAHERILFERLMARIDEGVGESQALLQGCSVELAPHQAQLVEENQELLSSLGFGIQPFGPNAFRLRAIPALLSSLAPERALWSVVEDLEENEAPLRARAEEMLVARICKAAAVKAGQVLSLAEQERMLRELEACREPRTCPHGRPTMIHFSAAALERQFGRRG